MADESCPLCEGEGKGLPGFYGTMADMFTLLFAFFVLMFSMATKDPAQLPGDGGVEGEGAAEEEQEKVEAKIEELENMDIYELQKECKKLEKEIKKMKNKKCLKYSYLKFKNY